MVDELSEEELRDRIIEDPSEDDIDDGLLLRTNFADALDGTEFEGALILDAEAAETLSKPHFTDLISLLDAHEVESVTELADELGKDKGTVSRHLNTLMKYDVVELRDQPNRKEPHLKHNHVLFSPLY